MTKLHVVCVLTCISAFSALAMPSRSSLQKVQGAVAELMAEDMAAMKKGKLAPEKAAETALGYAREATDEASKFLFLKGAFGLFVQGRKYDEAVQAIETLTREVKDVPDKVLADIIREKLKRVPKKDGGAVFELYDRVDRRMRSTAERAKLEAALKANPKDADARRQLAFAKAALGDWTGALGDFALVGGKASDAAKAEQGGKTPEAADLWWNLSEDEDERAVLREHAAGLYRQALDGGKLQGIKLSLAKKRVAECASESPAAAAPAREKAASAESAVSRSEPKKSSAAPAVRGKYDWTVPAKMKKQKMLDFDFGGGVSKMTFFAIPPGTFRVSLSDHPYSGFFGKKKINATMTRPFWISQFPVTVEQFKLFEGAELNAKAEEMWGKLSDDRNFAVLASTTPAGVDAYFAWLNETYGKLLPKGWVFRLPTLAESRFAEEQLNGRMVAFEHPYPYETKGTAKLKALQAKGFYLQYGTQRELAQKSWIERDYGKIVTDYQSLLRAKSYGAFSHSLQLDAISAPTISRGIKGLEFVEMMDSILAYGASERDPFRFCDSDAPSRFRATARGGWRSVDVVDEVVFSIAVGFDYVGEWKTKQGKK